jgi:1-aminocyclopropane-1-carboxylate deaminase/D-cysteine desulfhydrase-like pyridoxal-dependent ACC family enzyme
VRALLARFPRLADTLAHVPLQVSETPVESWRLGSATLLAKRDDLSAPALGGNKVRALELLLAGARAGDTLLTVGAAGSTHALAVATHGARLGLRTAVITWPQEMHDVAEQTARAIDASAEVTAAGSVAEAYARAALRRVRGRMHWVAAGGSVPLGALGHVDAALELADQLGRAGMSAPDTLVVPLGTGGTAAGLLVGLALSRLPTRIIGVRVVPSIIANRARVLRLARRTHALLARLAGEELPPLVRDRLLVEHDAYGGAYGRETPEGRAAAAALRDCGGPGLEPTYSAKAFAVALARTRRLPHERVLFWLTFDGRWLQAGGRAPAAPRPQPPSPVR